MALRVLAWDDVEERVKRTSKDPAAISGGGDIRTDSVAIPNGNSSLAVTFSTPLASASYSVDGLMFNNTDSTPIIQPIIITAKSTSGFTASWNFPVDSANYFLDYIAETGGSLTTVAGVQTIANSATSVTITLNPAFASTNYTVTGVLQNLSDSSPVYQSVIVTAKTVSTFTFSWNVPLESGNYYIQYQAQFVGP